MSKNLVLFLNLLPQEMETTSKPDIINSGNDSLYLLINLKMMTEFVRCWIRDSIMPLSYC